MLFPMEPSVKDFAVAIFPEVLTSCPAAVETEDAIYQLQLTVTDRVSQLFVIRRGRHNEGVGWDEGFTVPCCA